MKISYEQLMGFLATIGFIVAIITGFFTLKDKKIKKSNHPDMNKSGNDSSQKPKDPFIKAVF